MPVRFPLSVCESVDPVVLWGPDRVAVNVAAYAIAGSSERHLVWLDLAGRAPVAGDGENPLSRLADRTKHYRLRSPIDLAPGNPVPDLSSWILSRSDTLDRDVGRLADFLRLPRSVQELVTAAPEGRRGTVLLVTNADRAVELYPESEGSTRRFVRAVTDASVKLVVGLVGIERSDRFVFDHVFRLQGGGPGWRGCRLLAEKGGAPLPRSGGIPLGDFPEVDEALSPV